MFGTVFLFLRLNQNKTWVMRKKKHMKACHFTVVFPDSGRLSQTTVIPVEIVGLEDNSYHMIVPVEIEGIRGDMIIDTGASVTVVDAELFRDILKESEEIQMQSGSVTGQIRDVRLIKAGKFQIGTRKIKNIQLAAIDLKYVNEMYDKHLQRKIIGLLGSDFCVRYNVLIDYRNKRLFMSR